MIFSNRIYNITKKIPKGKVATYGQIAKLAGNSKAARAVGTLMKNNPYAPTVPCHRVVGFNGKLVGYSGGNGVSTKKKLLLSEGVSFKGDIVNLEVSLWRPKGRVI
jgi:methylated-DNA-protein-cysteine methyltransferase related protein